MKKQANEKVCNSCGKSKPAESFGVNNASGDRLQRTCKACRAEKTRIARMESVCGTAEPPLRERIFESKREGDRIRELARRSARNSSAVEEALERHRAKHGG